MLLISVGLILAAAFDQTSTRSLTWAPLIGLAIGGGAFLHLAAVFPRESALARRMPNLPLVGYGLAAISGVVALIMWSNGSAPSTALTARQFILRWFLISGGLYFVINLYHGVSASSPIQRLQCRIIAGAMLLGLAPLLLELITSAHSELRFRRLFAPSMHPSMSCIGIHHVQIPSDRCCKCAAAGRHLWPACYAVCVSLQPGGGGANPGFPNWSSRHKPFMGGGPGSGHRAAYRADPNAGASNNRPDVLSGRQGACRDRAEVHGRSERGQ